MLIGFKRSATSIVLRVKIRDSSVATGAGKTGLTSATSGLVISTIADNEASATTYTVAGSTIESITTLGTYATPTATKCRFKEVDSSSHKGIYELQIADARFAVSSARFLLVSISGASNAAECDIVIPLRDLDPYDAVRAGLTALPNANAEAAGGLYTRGSGAGQINQPANGQIDANTVKVGGTSQTARDLGASVLISSGSGTGQLDVTSGVVKANLAQILGTALTETSGQIAAGFKKFFNISSPAATMDHGVLMDTVTTLTNAPSDSSGVTTLLSRVPSGLFTGITSLAQWLGLIAGKQTGNSTARTEIRATGAGSGTFDETTDSQEALRDRGDAAWTTATGFSTLDAAGVRTAVGLASANLDTQIAAVQSDTDDIQTRLPAALTGGGNLKADAQVVSDKTGYALTSAYDPAKTASQAGDAMALTSGERTTLTAAIWNALTSGLTTANSIGKRIVDFLTGDVYGRLGAPAGASVSADVAAVKADTANIGTAGAGLTALGDTRIAHLDADVSSRSTFDGTSTLADSVPADGSRPSADQALYAIYQFLMERSVSGTTLTVNKPDGTTTLMTFTLDDATAPTSITRAT